MENIIIRDVRKEDIAEVVDVQINGWKAAYREIIDDEYLDTMSKEKLKKEKKIIIIQVL